MWNLPESKHRWWLGEGGWGGRGRGCVEIALKARYRQLITKVLKLTVWIRGRECDVIGLESGDG